MRRDPGKGLMCWHKVEYYYNTRGWTCRSVWLITTSTVLFFRWRWTTHREKHQVAIQIYKNNSATHTMRPGTNILIIKHIWSCRCGSEAICPLALGLDNLDIDLVFSPISFWDPLPPVFVWLPVLMVSAHFLYVSYWSRQSRQWSLVFVFHQSAFRLPSCLSTCVLLSD